jgi:hypothetical protein
MYFKTNSKSMLPGCPGLLKGWNVAPVCRQNGILHASELTGRMNKANAGVTGPRELIDWARRCCGWSVFSSHNPLVLASRDRHPVNKGRLQFAERSLFTVALVK